MNLTREDIIQSVKDGNLNPKIINQFLIDMKNKSFTYDYDIQEKLVNYHEERFTLDKAKSFIMDDVYSPDSDRVIEKILYVDYLVTGDKERYKRSKLYDAFLTPDDLNENIEFFRNNMLVFVNNTIFTKFKVKVRSDKLFVYFKYADLHELCEILNPGCGVSDICTEVTILFLPNAVIGTASELVPSDFSSTNVEGSHFTTRSVEMFNSTGRFFGFWVNNETKNHFIIPAITWDSANKFFTLPDLPPTDVTKYSLTIIGMDILNCFVDGAEDVEWFQFTTEQMPIPKANLIIMRKLPDKDVYVPNDGSISVTEYFPNIYCVNNPNNYQYRIFVLYDNRSHNEHISYDNEIEFYMRHVDLLELYKQGKVLNLLREYKSPGWEYGIQDFLNKNPYPQIDFNTKWDSFLYKLQSISDKLKSWFMFYEEYERRTYGYLTGWYHNIANYTNMESKLRDDTSPDVDNDDMYIEFKEPHYVFSYLNDTEYGDANAYIYFVDGRYTVPTAILVWHGYQYVYFPKKIIKEDTVIEVERFDGIVLSKIFDAAAEGNTFRWGDLAKVNTITNSLFLIDNETGEYFNNGEFDVFIIDPILGEFDVNLAKSVVTIEAETKIKIVPSSPEYVGKKVRLCCNNACLKFITRESGIDFARGWGEDVNLNMRGFIARVNKSLMPRLRLYTPDGRMVPKREYVVYEHQNYFQAPKYNLPLATTDDLYITSVYIGYDERLIYHKKVINSNGYVSLEGRVNRPFSLVYHDIYLDGFRLTKYDIERVSPYSFIIKNLAKYDTIYTLEIYEKIHVPDRFVQFQYNEPSQYIMDKLASERFPIQDNDFLDVLYRTLSKYTPTGKTYRIDSVRDQWYDFMRFWVPHQFLNADVRRDMECWNKIFDEYGRVLLNADDRVKYAKLIYLSYFLTHDYTVENGETPRIDRELDPATIVPDESIAVPENEYAINGGCIDNNFNPIYDEDFDLIIKPAAPGIPISPLAEKFDTEHTHNDDFNEADNTNRV